MTNLIVPQNYDKDGSSITASLSCIQDMKMNDINQIAENADSLIKILETIKQKKM